MSLTITDDDYQRYSQYFQVANPANGKLPGTEARNFLLKSQLPHHKLGQIWELSDIDRDGQLDLEEFCIAMKLVYHVLGGGVIPPALPDSLIPQNKRHLVIATDVAPVAATSGDGEVLSSAPSTATSTTATGTAMNWFVDSQDRANYERIFTQLAAAAGTGNTVKMLPLDDYLRSLGLPWPEVTHLWSLVDVRKYQELNKEQFVYFMHVVNGRLAGHHLPPTLPPAIKDKIYHSLDLVSNAVSGINYTRRTDSSTSLASSGGPKKPGLYGEKSRNVALADSYLSKLRNAGTFENKAGSRYASAQVNEEEIKKLRKQLAELDDELADVRRQQQELVKDHSLRRGGGDETLSDITTGREEDEVGAAIRELSLFLEYKQQKKKHVDQLLLGDSKDSAATGGEESETLSEVKKDVYDLRSWHTFLKAQIDALDAFVQKGQDELVKLQLEALEASKKSTS